MRVIGTAGHVDHGKSALVEALTGIHPDRLKEEREREMTIDLGFAWLTLPNGEEVGIVDVPGHRDFIENMLAGVGGIDAALFVVAADEGIMPQTREHLAILDLLQIRGGVVALTKIDLAPDVEWLDLVEDEVRQVLAGTVLADAPIVRVSARSGEGLADLLAALSERLTESPPRPDFGRPRLPIDRVFTIAGFGTVVTGTLSDGCLRVGDEVEILPAGIRGRVRGLQTHKRKEEISVPGSRTAVNISGVTVDQLQRGQVLVHPGDYFPTRRLDVRFRLLPDVSQPVKHNMEVKLFIGAEEVLARLRLLGAEEIHPGEEGWMQLEPQTPVVAVRGDRYILRRPSPGETLGGGVVIDPHPSGRHKRYAADVLTRLESLSHGVPTDVLLQALISLEGAAPFKEVLQASHLDAGVASQATQDLLARGELIVLESSTADLPHGHADGEAYGLPQPQDLVASRSYLETLTARALHELEMYHRANPLRAGMPREELKSRLKVSARLFSALIVHLKRQNAILESGPLIRLPTHTIRFTPQQRDAVERLMTQFDASPFAPPSIKECQAMVGVDVFEALVELGKLVPVSADVVFSRQGYERMVVEIRQLFEKNSQLTAAQVRDHFNTSRRYVLALLEHMDRLGITVRDGDYRRLKP